jgi:hypothetical protein
LVPAPGGETKIIISSLVPSRQSLELVPISLVPSRRSLVLVPIGVPALEALRRYQFNAFLPLKTLRWYQLNCLASRSPPSVPIQRLLASRSPPLVPTEAYQFNGLASQSPPSVPTARPCLSKLSVGTNSMKPSAALVPITHPFPRQATNIFVGTRWYQLNTTKPSVGTSCTGSSKTSPLSRQYQPSKTKPILQTLRRYQS